MPLRLKCGLRDALAGALTIWATLYAHVFWVFGIKAGYLDGGSFPMMPSVPVTLWTLAQETAIAGALFVLPALIVALIAFRTSLRTPLLALIWAVVWFWSAGALAGLFAPDFGTTWGVGEVFFDLFRHPLLTPLAFGAGLAGFLALAQRAP